MSNDHKFNPFGREYRIEKSAPLYLWPIGKAFNAKEVFILLKAMRFFCEKGLTPEASERFEAMIVDLECLMNSLGNNHVGDDEIRVIPLFDDAPRQSTILDRLFGEALNVKELEHLAALMINDKFLKDKGQRLQYAVSMIGEPRL